MSTILQSSFNKVAQAYVLLFEKKQDLVFSEWVGGHVGELACFNEWYYLKLDDIRYDIDTEQPTERITDWFDKCVEDKKTIDDYRDYCRDLRPQYVKDYQREVSLKRAKENLVSARKYFEQALAEIPPCYKVTYFIDGVLHFDTFDNGPEAMKFHYELDADNITLMNANTGKIIFSRNVRLNSIGA